MICECVEVDKGEMPVFISSNKHDKLCELQSIKVRGL